MLFIHKLLQVSWCNIPLPKMMFIPFGLQIFVWIGLVNMNLDGQSQYFVFIYGFSLVIFIVLLLVKGRSELIEEETENKLKSCEDLWQLAMQASNDGIWDFNFITQQKFLSKRCIEIHGYECSEVTNIEQWLALIHPDDREAVKTAFQKHIDREVPKYIAEYRFLCKDGQYKCLLDRGQAIWNEAGKPVRIIGSLTDIHDRYLAERALRQSESQLKAFLDNASTPITIKDLEGTYISVNSEFAYWLQIPETEIINKKDYEIFPKNSIKKLRQYELQAIFEEIAVTFEESILLPDGLHTFIITKFPLLNENNKPYAVGGIYLDISDRKKAEITLEETQANLRLVNQELERLVNLDGLTQIANRRCFNDRIIYEWNRLHRERKPLALLMFDVDYFKRYNDHYGHQLGDECLVRIAQAVHNLIQRPADLVARYGGEEFIVILPNTNIAGAITVAQRVHNCIKELKIPHLYSEVSNIVTISQGIACAVPDLERSPYTLIQNVDLALYQAKQQGRNQSFVFEQ